MISEEALCCHTSFAFLLHISSSPVLCSDRVPASYILIASHIYYVEENSCGSLYLFYKSKFTSLCVNYSICSEYLYSYFSILNQKRSDPLRCWYVMLSVFHLANNSSLPWPLLPSLSMKKFYLLALASNRRRENPPAWMVTCIPYCCTVCLIYGTLFFFFCAVPPKIQLHMLSVFR